LRGDEAVARRVIGPSTVGFAESSRWSPISTAYYEQNVIGGPGAFS